MADCLFCRMVEGEVPVDKLYEDDLLMAVLDIHPLAPVHFMIIPKEHVPTVRELRGEHGPLLARIFTTAAKVAKDEGVSGSGYRLAFNIGDDAGMTTPHLPLHCLGARRLGPEG